MKELAKATEKYFDKAYGDKATELRQAIAEYMGKCPEAVNISSPSLPEPDEPNPQPLVFLSDGEWFWSIGGVEVVKNGSVDPEPDFVNHVIKQKTPPDNLDEATKASVFKMVLDIKPYTTLSI